MSPKFFCLFEFEFSGKSKTRLEKAIIFRAIVLERVCTYIWRVPQCISPRRNWYSPNPSLASECAPPPRGGAHSPEGEGFGESQFRRLEKKLSTLPTLWSKVDQSWEIWLRGSYSIKADLGGQLKGTVAWDGFFYHSNLGPKLAEIGIF